MIKKIEAKYPGQGVAKFVYECWAELKLFNASGGTSPVSPNLYESRTRSQLSVVLQSIPWHIAEKRELREVSRDSHILAL